jgi:hypothetical protein
MTQRQANELFEGPVLDMASLYSRTGMLYLLVCFYTPMIPLIPFIAAVGIAVQYWIEKYLLLRRHKVPETQGSAMAKFYASICTIGMLLYAIGNYVFCYRLSEGDNTHGQWALWFMIAYYVFPIGFLLNSVSVKVKRDNKLTYNEVRYGFVQDYDRTNPMTERAAKVEYFREIKEKGGAEAEDNKEDIEKFALADLAIGNDKLGGIMNYGHLGGKSSKKSKKDVGKKERKVNNKFLEKMQKLKKNKGGDKKAIIPKFGQVMPVTSNDSDSKNGNKDTEKSKNKKKDDKKDKKKDEKKK